jgi:hypothetical protein
MNHSLPASHRSTSAVAARPATNIHINMTVITAYHH